MLNWKSLRKPLIFLLYILLFSSCSKEKVLTNSEIEWLKNNDSISIALFPYYPPYQFINKNNTIEGVFIDYLDLIEEKIEHKFKRKYYFEWSKVLSDAKTKQVDMILEAQQSWERHQYLIFHNQLFDTPYAIVTAKNNSSKLTLSKLEGKEVAVPKGYAIEEFLKRNFPKIILYTYASETDALERVNRGEHLAYIGPKAVANYLINYKNFNALKISEELDHSYAPGIAVDKTNDTLNNIITKALKSISEKERQGIIDSWLYKETIPFYKRVNFFAPLLIFFVLLLIIIIDINFYLSQIVKQKTAALRKATDVAEKDNSLKTAFINNVSHDIKVPVNNILLFSKFLKKEEMANVDKTVYIEAIVNSCKQLIENMDNTLEISKLQTKQVKLYQEETNITELLDVVFSTYETKAKKKGIELIVHNTIDEYKNLLLIDKIKFTKTIGALLRNAITYTNKGAVLVTCMIKKKYLTITVRDSGVGIDPKDQKHIFKSFSKSKDQISQRYQGLGLGLTIALENTKMMKGQLSFSSVLDKGSTFRLEIPYFPVLKEKSNKENIEIRRKENTKTYLILIAEDGDVNFLVLKTILSKMKEYSFTIHRAVNGKEAVLFSKETDMIDLILMDIKMPEMNGYEATKQIKQIYPLLPVIAQTAYTSKEDIKNAFDAGCDDFISKPINPKMLKKMIDTYLPISVE